MEIIPAKERKKIRDRKIKALYRLGYTMDQIVAEMKQLGQNVSKPTVFFAIKGRAREVNVAAHNAKRRKKTAIKSGIINHINKTNK